MKGNLIVYINEGSNNADAILDYLSERLAKVTAAGKDIIDGLIINDSTPKEYQVVSIDTTARIGTKQTSFEYIKDILTMLTSQGHKVALLAYDTIQSGMIEAIRKSIGYPTSYAIIVEGKKIDKDGEHFTDPNSFISTIYYSEQISHSFVEQRDTKFDLI